MFDCSFLIFFFFFWFQDTLKREVCDLKKAAEGSDIQRQELQVEFLPSGLGSKHRRGGGGCVWVEC